MRWNPGKQYRMEGVLCCYSLTVTAAGEVVVLVQTQSDTYEAWWYNQQGKLIHTSPGPPQCGHEFLKVLAVEVGGKQQVSLSCWQCQCIWLGAWGGRAWSVAWLANGEKGSVERKGQPWPYTMCQGKPGQIIAWNVQGGGKSVIMFNITQIPFRVVVPEIKIGMDVCDLCYCELPGVGGALAVTDGRSGFKLSMFSMDSGELLWSVQGWDERGQSVKVAGAEWLPQGVCSDNRGRLYLADYHMGNSRIIVLSAASGSVLQVVQGRRHWEEGKRRWVSEPGITVYGADMKYQDDEPMKGVLSGTVLQELKHTMLGGPDHLCWHEQSKSIVVYHRTGSDPYDKHHITSFHVKF